MPETSKAINEITRKGATADIAAAKLEKAMVYYVKARVPTVRSVSQRLPPIPAGEPTWEASPYDFYQRNPVNGDVLTNAQGKDKIRPLALAKSVERLQAEIFNEIVARAIEDDEAVTARERAAAAKQIDKADE